MKMKNYKSETTNHVAATIAAATPSLQRERRGGRCHSQGENVSSHDTMSPALDMCDILKIDDVGLDEVMSLYKEKALKKIGWDPDKKIKMTSRGQCKTSSPFQKCCNDRKMIIDLRMTISSAKSIKRPI